jgi:hypothetical protein
MNNFAALTSTAAVLAPFLQMRLTIITSLIYQEQGEPFSAMHISFTSD